MTASPPRERSAGFVRRGAGSDAVDPARGQWLPNVVRSVGAQDQSHDLRCPQPRWCAMAAARIGRQAVRRPRPPIAYGHTVCALANTTSCSTCRSAPRGLYAATSDDGLHWSMLNGRAPVLSPEARTLRRNIVGHPVPARPRRSDCDVGTPGTRRSRWGSITGNYVSATPTRRSRPDLRDEPAAAADQISSNGNIGRRRWRMGSCVMSAVVTPAC
jgi:hypothetical protein